MRFDSSCGSGITCIFSISIPPSNFYFYLTILCQLGRRLSGQTKLPRSASTPAQVRYGLVFCQIWPRFRAIRPFHSDQLIQVAAFDSARSSCGMGSICRCALSSRRNRQVCSPKVIREKRELRIGNPKRPSNPPPFKTVLQIIQPKTDLLKLLEYSVQDCQCPLLLLSKITANNDAPTPNTMRM